MQCSAGQSQSTRQGQIGQRIISPEPGSTGQRGPHQQPSICCNRTWAIFTESSLDSKRAHTHTHTHTHTQTHRHTDTHTHTHTHTHRLFGQWKKLRTTIVCSVVFIYKNRDELSRHLCSALFMSSHLCWGTWLFPWAPPDCILAPPVPPH